WYKLVGVFADYGRRYRSAFSNGRRVFILSGISIPWAVPFWGKTSYRMGPLGIRFYGVLRFLDFRLLHHYYECMDAASRRLPHPAEWCVRSDEFLGAAIESMGAAAIWA